VKIYVLLYGGIKLHHLVDVGSKYASNELQHENIEVYFFEYMIVCDSPCLFAYSAILSIQVVTHRSGWTRMLIFSVYYTLIAMVL